MHILIHGRTKATGAHRLSPMVQTIIKLKAHFCFFYLCHTVQLPSMRTEHNQLASDWRAQRLDWNNALHATDRSSTGAVMLGHSLARSLALNVTVVVCGLGVSSPSDHPLWLPSERKFVVFCFLCLPTDRSDYSYL